MNNNAQQIKVTILIPVQNEVDSVTILAEKIDGVLLAHSHTRKTYEIIFVDDGSTDGTRSKLEALTLGNCLPVKVILFRRNFGKSAALAAGFQEAKGDIIVTMDGDLQDEADEIPNFLDLINQGYDLVSGWKQSRKDPLEKRIPSKLFNFLATRLTKLKLNDFNCGFKAYRSWCVRRIRLSGNLYRFLPVFVAIQGGKIGELSVKHNPRAFGNSKYGIERYLHGFFDLITITLLARFLYRPNYFFGLFALPMLACGTGIGLYLLFCHFVWLVTSDTSFQLVNRPLLNICFALLGNVSGLVETQS